MMNRCDCGSYAINPTMHGREPDKRLDLCDVCYWLARIAALEAEVVRLRGALEEIANPNGGGCNCDSNSEHVIHLQDIAREVLAPAAGEKEKPCPRKSNESWRLGSENAVHCTVCKRTDFWKEQQ